MAKAGKLTKLKSVLKKLNSFNKRAKITSDNHSSMDLQPVYVGKSRRRYLVNSNVIEHPVFRELVEKSEDSGSVNVGCEVVLFEHLLWMLENADTQLESLDELADYYAY